MVTELSVSLTRHERILRLKLSNNCMQIDSEARRQPDHGRVHLPVLVGVRRSETFLGLDGMHPLPRTFPASLMGHLVPRACRREELAKALGVER